MIKDFNGSHQIGYGKPPISGQFKKGNSGNPKGRPKGSKNLAAIVLREGRKPVKVNGPKGSKTISKIEAAVLQMANQAAQGNLRAANLYLNLTRSAEEANQGVENVGPTSTEMDRTTMQSLLKRMRRFTPSADQSQASLEPGGENESR